MSDYAKFEQSDGIIRHNLYFFLYVAFNHIFRQNATKTRKIKRFDNAGYGTQFVHSALDAIRQHHPPVHMVVFYPYEGSICVGRVIATAGADLSPAAIITAGAVLPLTQNFSEHLEFFFVVTLHNQHYVFSHHKLSH